MSEATTATNGATVESKSVSLAEIRKGLPENLPAVRMGFETNQSFELMQRVAKVFASSTMVPEQYQGNIGNCCIALNMSNRMQADPLLVMQNLYVVYGRPSWSAKFLVATFNHCGRFTPIKYKFSGTPGKDDWACVAWAKDRETGEIVEGPQISIALAKAEGWYEKKGSKWKTIPQLMLSYRAASWLVNTVAPEVSMGLPTREEIQDVYETERAEDGAYEVTTESLRKPRGKNGKPKFDGDPQIPPISIPNGSKAEESEVESEHVACANPECGDTVTTRPWDGPNGEACCSQVCAKHLSKLMGEAE